MDRKPDAWPEGVHFKRPVVDHAGRLIKKELPLGRAESLRALSEDYSFFTPALLYLLGVITDVPLIDFLYEYRKPVDFYWKQFRFPMFRGLETKSGDTGWNRGLWAVRREHWEPFCDFYCSISVSNAVLKKLWSVGLQQLTILDPLALDLAGLALPSLPTLTIAAFGVDSNQFIAAFQSGCDPLTEPPRLAYYAASQRKMVFAAALYEGVNPHTAEELYSLKQCKDTP